MNNWNLKTHQLEEPSQNVQEFLKAINAVCRTFNLSISHEDEQGAFIIEDYKPENIVWLNVAHLNCKDNESTSRSDLFN